MLICTSFTFTHALYSIVFNEMCKLPESIVIHRTRQLTTNQHYKHSVTTTYKMQLAKLNCYLTHIVNRDLFSLMPASCVDNMWYSYIMTYDVMPS